MWGHRFCGVGAVSPRGHYFKQAQRCLRLADGCTDRAMAERLRELAAEFEAKGLDREELASNVPEASSQEAGPEPSGKV